MDAFKATRAGAWWLYNYIIIIIHGFNTIKGIKNLSLPIILNLITLFIMGKLFTKYCPFILALPRLFFIIYSPGHWFSVIINKKSNVFWIIILDGLNNGLKKLGIYKDIINKVIRVL